MYPKDTPLPKPRTPSNTPDLPLPPHLFPPARGLDHPPLYQPPQFDPKMLRQKTPERRGMKRNNTLETPNNLGKPLHKMKTEDFLQLNELPSKKITVEPPVVLPLHFAANEFLPQKDINQFNVYSRNYGVGKSLFHIFKDLKNIPFHLDQFFNPNVSIPEEPESEPSESVIFNVQDIPMINKASYVGIADVIKQAKGNEKPGENIRDINRVLAGKPRHSPDIAPHLKSAVEISEFISFNNVAHKKEEDAEPETDYIKKLVQQGVSDSTIENLKLLKQILNNWVISSFKPKATSNNIDDLADLLAASTEFSDIKRQIGQTRYRDPLFGGDRASITGFGQGSEMETFRKTNFVWTRPDQIFQGRYSVYDKIESSDIIQGLLGDCYLMAAISSISNIPQRLERVFLTKKVNANGIYIVALCINGLWEEVIMDDRFPCDGSSGRPTFCQSNTNEIWVMLLEKAWAKIHGGYFNIGRGLTREALRDLTGASAKTFFVDTEQEKLFPLMVEAFNRRYVMTAGSRNLSQGKDIFIKEIGIAGSHAYSILELILIAFDGPVPRVAKLSEEKQLGGRCERLLRLRNPWGKREWNGDWSRNSKKWTPELRQQLGIGPVADGSFFMTFRDFSKFFYDIQICYYADGFKYTGLKVSSKPSETVYFAIEILKKGEYFISVNQKNKRFFPDKDKYEYSHLALLVGNRGQHLGCSIKQDKENWIRIDAKPGTHFAVVKTPWIHCVNEFSLSVYGVDRVQIVQRTKDAEMTAMLESMALSHARSLEKKIRQQQKTQLRYLFFDSKGGFCFVFAQNYGNLNLSVTCELVNARHIMFAAPNDGMRPTFQLGPGQTKILFLEATKENYSTELRIASIEAPQPNYADKARLQGERVSILVKQKEVGISLYVLKYDHGVLMSYENLSQNFTLHEKLNFALDNCFINNSIGNYIEVNVNPGEKQVIMISKSPDSADFSVQLQSRHSEVSKI